MKDNCLYFMQKQLQALTGMVYPCFFVWHAYACINDHVIMQEPVMKDLKDLKDLKDYGGEFFAKQQNKLYEVSCAF